MASSARFRLNLFSRPALTREDGAVLSGRATQRHRVALLALLAVARGGSVSRDRLMALLWPDADSERQRNLLKVSVYVLRQSLHEAVLVTERDELRLNPDVIETDVGEFEDAVAHKDYERAVKLSSAPFLDGFLLKGAPDFAHWTDGERARLAAARANALEVLALTAERRGDTYAAASWWKQRAADDPFDSRVAQQLIRALDASGNPAGALRHATIHERLLRDELGVVPGADLTTLVAAIRARPPVDASSHLTLGEQSIPAPATAPARAMDAVRDEPLVNFADKRSRQLRTTLPYGIAAVAVGALLYGVVVRGRAEPVTPAQIADSVVLKLGSRLAMLAPRRDQSPIIAANEFYRMGTDELLFRSDSGARLALTHLRQATELDSNFAAAYAALAMVYVRVRTGEGREAVRSHRIALARAASTKAVHLNPLLGDAHMARAIVHMQDREWVEAERALRVATEVDANLFRAHEYLAGLHVIMGKLPEALNHARLALALDSLSPTANAEYARALVFNGQCAEAQEYLGRIANLARPLLRTASLAAHCLAREQRWSDALAAVQQTAPQSGRHGQALIGYLRGRAGDRSGALMMLDSLSSALERNGDGAYYIALVHSGLADFDAAFDWFDRSLDDRSFPMIPIEMVIFGPLFEDLQRHPRFKNLRRNLNLPTGR
jgi:DNA-binding SARP family transcriptional activator/Flp pilus assembly protein TadD